MNLNDLRMSLKSALDNMWARIDARITAIEQGGGGGGVTGVKGDAESSYRQGNVNLTAANIGALAVDGSNAMQNWIAIDTSLASGNERGIDIAMSGGKHWYLYPINNGSSFTIAGYDGTGWFSALTVDMATQKVSLSQPLGITSGGTGETQGTIDITDQCSWHGSFYSKNLIYNPYLKMVFGSFAVYGNVANQAYLVTLPSSVPIVSKTPCGIGTSNTNGVSIAVDFEGRNLKSSHSVNSSVSEPRYVIQAYVG